MPSGRWRRGRWMPSSKRPSVPPLGKGCKALGVCGGHGQGAPGKTFRGEAPEGAAFVKDAPAAVVVCGDPSASGLWVEDCSIAAVTMQYAALALGLGSRWAQMRGIISTKAKHQRSISPNSWAFLRT